MRTRISILLALALLLGNSAVADRIPELKLSDSDPRLTQKVTVGSQGEHLEAILERLSRQTGVRLRANPPMRDTVLVLQYSEKPLHGLMTALADFFAADIHHRPIWERTTVSGIDTYRLVRDLRLEEWVKRSREQETASFFRRIEALVRTFEMTEADWNVLRQRDPDQAAVLREVRKRVGNSGLAAIIGGLSPDRRLAIMRGGILRVPLAELAQGNNRGEYARQVLGTVRGTVTRFENDRRVTYQRNGYAGDGLMTLYVGGRGSERGIVTRYEGDSSGPGEISTGRYFAGDYFPDVSARGREDTWQATFGGEAQTPPQPLEVFRGETPGRIRKSLS